MPKEYPSCIVPRHQYRYRLPMRKLLADYPDVAVVRRCKQEQPFVMSTSGNYRELRTDALEDNLLEMSVNLLGGLFKMRHLPFAPSLEIAKIEWDGKQIPVLPVPVDNYSEKSEAGIIGFRVSQVNAFTFPYTKAVEKKDYSRLQKEAEKIKKRERLDVDGELVEAFGQSDKGLTTVRAWLHVNHHPTLLNYWHMQIDVYPAGSEKYLNYDNKSGEARRVRHRLREQLSRLAICELGNSYHIGTCYYKRNTGCVKACVDEIWNWTCRHCFKFTYSTVPES